MPNLRTTALRSWECTTRSIGDNEGLHMSKASLGRCHRIPPVQISPTKATFASGVRAVAGAQARAPRWSASRGELVVVDRRSRERRAEDEFTPVRVLLAHGERLTRAGLRALLQRETDITVAAEAASSREAITRASEIRPDVVLMSVRLPGLGGVEATRRIIADPKLSGVKVLMLSEDERDEDLFDALRAGARGFLIRDTEPAELLRAVRVLAGGGVQLSPSVARRLIDEVASQPDPQRLTPELFEELSAREREVVTLVALGLSNDEIAERLVVSPATAKTHVSRAMLKLHAHDRAKLVALAYQTGFAQPPRNQGPAAKLQRQRAGAIAAGGDRSASGPRPDPRLLEISRPAPWAARKGKAALELDVDDNGD
jgi:DNA-binding NarL/FixJ family response regulator